MMHWPWRRKRSADRMVVSWSGGTLAYVLARREGGRYRVLRAGVEHQGSDSREAWVARLVTLGLSGYATDVMLTLEQYQLFHIAAPAVAPEELRAAARYQIKDLVDVHLDDLTVDVLHVGDGQGRAAAQILVVAAHQAVLREVMALAASMRWDVQVIDVHDTAQRNLQSAHACEDASCALWLADATQALLTFCKGGELFYSRRLEVPTGFLRMPWASARVADAALPDAYTPVEEYVPQYGLDALGSGVLGPDDVRRGASALDADRAQRLVVELQRSIDVWERQWASAPLAGVRVLPGPRSAELAQWLQGHSGQEVDTLDMGVSLDGVDRIAPHDLLACGPLLGVLLRSDSLRAQG